MSYTQISPTPANIDAGEIALLLDGGIKVAATVTTERPVNNTGLIYTVSVRCINNDGTTQTCGCNDPIDTHFTHVASAEQIADLSANTIAQQMLKMALGEPTDTRVVNGEVEPLIDWPTEVLATTSIRNAKLLANSVVDDVGAVLGL